MIPTITSATAQSQFQVLLKKFSQDVLHDHQAGMSVTDGRVMVETLDAYNIAIPKMGTIEFRDISRGTVPPLSQYTSIPLKDRLLFVNWKAVQNIRRIDHDLESHIQFQSNYQISVKKAYHRKKDQTVFAAMLANAPEKNEDETNYGQVTTTSIALPTANVFRVDTTVSGFNLKNLLSFIRQKFEEANVGYQGEKIYCTATPIIKALLKRETEYISGDYRQNKPLGEMDSLMDETNFADITFVKTPRDLIPDVNNTLNSLKYETSSGSAVEVDYLGGKLTGVSAVSSTGTVTATKAQGFRPVIFWTKESTKRGEHSRGMRTILYLDPQRMNSPAIQHDFFTGAVRLYEDSVYVLLLK